MKSLKIGKKYKAVSYTTPHCFGQYLKDKACKVCRLKTKCKQYELETYKLIPIPSRLNP